jgi:hypothetical protein
MAFIDVLCIPLSKYVSHFIYARYKLLHTILNLINTTQYKLIMRSIRVCSTDALLIITKKSIVKLKLKKFLKKTI